MTVTGFLIRRGKCPLKAETHRGSAVWLQRQKLEWHVYKPRNECQGSLAPAEAGRGKEIFHPEYARECDFADTLILDLKLPEQWENRFLLLTPHSLWYFVTETLRKGWEGYRMAPQKSAMWYHHDYTNYYTIGLGQSEYSVKVFEKPTNCGA